LPRERIATPVEHGTSMTTEDANEKRGFKVQDHRRFSESGEARDDRPDREEAAPSQPTAGQMKEPPPAPAPDLEINFSTFVISLSTQALAHLGEIPDPIHNAVATDLAAAREMIDILGMLREKTKGNLDRAEQALLDNILYDLRMRFVQSTQVRR
jgi:hypothetical protein